MVMLPILNGTSSNEMESNAICSNGTGSNDTGSNDPGTNDMFKLQDLLCGLLKNLIFFAKILEKFHCFNNIVKTIAERWLGN